MDINEFKDFVQQKEKPKGLNRYLEAMFEDAMGNWNKAHQIAQDIPNDTGSWIHAYLHRKEGDNWNANYWYNKAGRHMPAVSLEKEWEEISEELLVHYSSNS